MGNIGLTFLGILLFVSSVFMMLLILVQRGKGGGLTGALGGMGGQSAFGAKAGDVFTRITVVTAIIWITLCMITIAAFNPPPSSAGLDKDEDIPAMSAVEDDETDEATTDDQAADAEDDGLSLDQQAQDYISDVGEDASGNGDEQSSDDGGGIDDKFGEDDQTPDTQPAGGESTADDSKDSDGDN